MNAEFKALEAALRTAARFGVAKNAVLYAAKAWRRSPNPKTAKRLVDAVDALVALELEARPPEAQAAARRRP